MSIQSHNKLFAYEDQKIGNKKNLLFFNQEELCNELLPITENHFRGKQIWQWVYQKGSKDFSQMTNLKLPVREALDNEYVIYRPDVEQHLISEDGTQKWLLKFSDRQTAEVVFIPEKNRGTLCISSQVGCTLTCRFCHTGTQPLVRNLTPTEIISQLAIAKDYLNDWEFPGSSRKITNIVMMGMGEPLYNYENVSKALHIIMDPHGFNFSKRRITLSTSGVVPLMEKCGEELGVNLALSLHATNNELRSSIMPLNNKYPLEEVIEACRNYPRSRQSGRITFEYVLLKGINDDINDAKALVKLIKGIPSKVNLIPFNPWPGSIYERPGHDRIERFAEIIRKAGYPSPVRRPRGQDIFAACGQLKTNCTKKKSKG